MIPPLLIGYGAHGHDIAAIAERCDYPLSITDETLPGIVPPRMPVLLGVNNPRTRREMAARYSNGAAPLVDPTAITGPNVELGGGCVIAPGAILLRDVVLGRHVHVNYGASMTRCTVGDFTTIAPAATICGDVEIGEAVFIGAGAVICNLVSIGDEAVVGAGAIVTRDVAAGQTVVSPLLRAVA